MRTYEPTGREPGIYDNRRERHMLPGQTTTEAWAYIVRAATGEVSGHTTRKAARDRWDIAKIPPPAAKKKGRPSARLSPPQEKRQKARPGPSRVKRKMRRAPKNPKVVIARREEMKVLKKHLKGPKASKGCRDRKHVCSKCGWIIRTSYLRASPGTIRHEERWDKPTQDFVPCGGVFIPVE